MSPQLSTNTIFTIGHSNHDMATFLKIVSDHSIQVLVDVRSAPYSKYVSQFNKPKIEKAATDSGLQYIFMGDAIGGKPSNPIFLDTSGKVLYDKIASSDTFQHGIDRLEKGILTGWTIVLMCAEENPLKCHRHLLIANELELSRKIPVWHIRSGGVQIRAKNYLNKQPIQLKLF